MPLPKDTTLEFSLTARKSAGLEKSILQFLAAARPGAQGGIVTTEFKTRSRWSCYTRRPAQTRKLVKLFAQNPIRGVTAAVRRLDAGDWRDRWLHYFRPMRFGRDFMILPDWQKKIPSAAKRCRILRLDPAGAFGSGAHETTRLMMRMLDLFKGRARSFLDVGTGSGILAVAAALQGAREVWGVDLDPVSVRAARRNLRLNGIRHGKILCADISRLPVRKKFNLVAANFISADLIAHQEKIAALTAFGGYLAVSGISRRNAPDFLKRFHPAGLRLKKRFPGRSWAGFLYFKG